MVVRSKNREASRNPLKELDGYKQAVAAVLDAADRKDGALPTQVTMELTEEQVRDVVAAFRPTHFSRQGRRVVIYPPRIARDEFEDKPKALLDTWYADQGRTPRRLRAELEERRALLRANVLGLPSHPARHTILADLDNGSGWITGLLLRQGVDAASREAAAVISVLRALPLPIPTRAKVFAGKVLGSSHALDPGTSTYNHVADFLLEAEATNEDATPLGDARRGVLDENNLVLNLTHPKALVSGRLRLDFNSEPDDKVILNTARGLATALTLQEILKSSPAPPFPKAIISIENEDPFNDLAALVPHDVLLVFTGGHANSAVRAILRHPTLKGIPRFHWGDVDAGGFRILETLRTDPPPLPILMDAETVRADPKRLTTLDSQKRDSITRYQASAPDKHRAALQECLNRNGYLEQEVVSASEAWHAIEADLQTLVPRGL